MLVWECSIMTYSHNPVMLRTNRASTWGVLRLITDPAARRAGFPPKSCVTSSKRASIAGSNGLVCALARSGVIAIEAVAGFVTAYPLRPFETLQPLQLKG